MKRALITGINGQDGSYLAEFLIDKEYEVYGVLKRNSVAENQTARLDNVYSKLTLEYADLTDMSSLVRVIQKIMPDEIYNLAAQSHVRISFDQPIYTAQVTGLGTLNLLEAVKLIKPNTKIYQASSSEMFGNSIDSDGFQRETTPMNPVSPYGCAKVFSYNICRNYRNSYGMFISNGILFNHESPRRGTNFVTNKVCKEAVRHGFKIYSHRTYNEMNTFVYINGRPDHQKGQHDDLIMGISMAIYIAESSFSKLEKATEQAKFMIDSWSVVNNESVGKETHFDPLIPNQNVLKERMGLNNNGATRDDYQKYNWLFGGIRG